MGESPKSDTHSETAPLCSPLPSCAVLAPAACSLDFSRSVHKVRPLQAPKVKHSGLHHTHRPRRNLLISLWPHLLNTMWPFKTGSSLETSTVLGWKQVSVGDADYCSCTQDETSPQTLAQDAISLNHLKERATNLNGGMTGHFLLARVTCKGWKV